jgi:hypothetical protein
MTFTSPISLFLAVLIAIALFVVGWMRRPALPRVSLLLAMFGIIFLTLATGGISCRRGREPRIAIMVDCSPSTRGASFRDAEWVRSRLRELLGDRPYELYAFADTSQRMREDDAIAEMPADHTTFSPPPVDHVLLFSDGRVDVPPTTPPVHVVIDPALASPEDAAIVELEEPGNQLAATVRNTGKERVLSWVNKQRQSATAPTGSTVLTTPLVTTTETITARLSPADAWPENDALAIRPSPPMASQRWWVGDAPPRGWMAMSSANLPLEGSAWLGPAIVVLNNIPADAIGNPQQDRLEQYIRDLGGALVIIGGDHAFAAGHYPGSELEMMSPLSSSPPEPVRHWVLLLDSSGSMSAPAGNATRFKVASDALVSVLRELPKSDLASIGGFARELRWWSVAKNVADTSLMSLPPPDVAPSGPTNLEAALHQIIGSLPASPPIDLLVLSDAEAEFGDVETLAAALRQHHIRLHALAVASQKSSPPLRRLAEGSGGQFLEEIDSQKWLASVRRMLRAVMPDQLIREPVTVTFGGILSALGSRPVSLMNHTWPKQSATVLATAMEDTDKVSAAAKWSVGTGDVLAFAFAPTPDEIAAVEQAIARRPRDPRFNITWHAGPTLHLRIDARDNDTFLNDQKLTIDLNLLSAVFTIPQTGPGRYEIELPAPRSPMTVTIFNDQHVLDEFAVAGRYPREFDAVGNDLDALRALAERSGGSVIEPSQHGELEFPDTRRVTSFAGSFAIVGALLLAASLIVWRVA